MKKLSFVILITLFCTSYANAQKRSANQLHPLKSTVLRNALCNIDTFFRRSNDDVRVTVFLISNNSGSAGLPETDEISNRYVITTSTPDQNPKQFMYVINDLILPKIVEFEETEDHSYRLTIEYGTTQNRTKKTIRITSSTAKVISN